MDDCNKQSSNRGQYARHLTNGHTLQLAELASEEITYNCAGCGKYYKGAAAIGVSHAQCLRAIRPTD